MIRLRVLGGPNQGAVLDVDEDEAIIGSDAERCTVLLMDRTVRPVHVTIKRLSDDEMTLETAEDATVSLDGQEVPPGLYATGAVVLLTIGRNEMLVQCRATAPETDTAKDHSEAADAPTDALEDADSTAPPPPAEPTRRWKSMLLLLLFVAGLSIGFYKLIQSPPQPGLLSLPTPAKGTAASATSQSKAEGPRPTTPRPADERTLSYDPNPATQAATITRLDSGTVLFEPAPAQPPAAPPVTKRLLRRFVDDPDGLIVETTAGERFELKSDRRDGYTMRWISDEAIELQRGTETLHIKVE